MIKKGLLCLVFVLSTAIDDTANGKYSTAFVTSDDVYLEDYNILKFKFIAEGEDPIYLGFYMQDLKNRMSSTSFSLGNDEKKFLGVQLTGIENKYTTVELYLSDGELKEGGGQ